jgi:hypothetical protein
MTAKTPDTVAVEVEVLKNDVGEIKSSLSSLYSKIDRSVGELGSEMRRAIDVLSSQINERSKTPWAVIWGGLSVIILLMGFIANQALSPIMSDIHSLKDNIVTRTEHETRWASNEIRLKGDEQALLQIQDRRYAEATKQSDRLAEENKEIRVAHLRDMQDQINKVFARDRATLEAEKDRLETEVRELRRVQDAGKATK